jgi:FixJ family two-component response regulator
MGRKCSVCQHVKRAEINGRLAAGEPGNQIAHDYGLNPSSLHRHRANCLGLSSSNAIMKDVARGNAAVACLPSKDELGTAYFKL